MVVQKRVVKIKSTPQEAANYRPVNKGVNISWVKWDLKDGTCVVLVTGSDMVRKSEQQIDEKHMDDEVYSRLAFLGGKPRLVEDSLKMPSEIPANKPIMRLNAFLDDQRLDDLPRNIRNIKEQYKVSVKESYLKIINNKMETQGFRKLRTEKIHTNKDTGENMHQLSFAEIEN